MNKNKYLAEATSIIKNILECMYYEGFRDGFNERRSQKCIHENMRPVNINGKVEFYQCPDCSEIIRPLDNII